MESLHKTTSMVENFFSKLLTKASISDNIFIGDMPITMSAQWKDMVLIDIVSIQDYGGCAKGSVNVFLFAKPMDGVGRKPIKRLLEMEKVLTNVIENSTDAHYAIDINFRDSDYDKARNYYFNIVNVDIIIK